MNSRQTESTKIEVTEEANWREMTSNPSLHVNTQYTICSVRTLTISIFKKDLLKKKDLWAGKMAQRLGALTALLEILNSDSSNHLVPHNHPLWDLTPSSGASEGSYSVLRYNNKSLKKKKKKRKGIPIRTPRSNKRKANCPWAGEGLKLPKVYSFQSRAYLVSRVCCLYWMLHWC